ncbi:MAG: flagellar hook-associated protein FlgK [Spirochaetaceae bacterium]|jgi:flagellar hook-associated protein 1 FlgK|nr:flagellar hook-associated protein FlgK [Spirochaetaceae bacterium]
MTSTFSGLEIGKRGVMAHENALQVTGHNLTNASTEGYSRQRIDFNEMEPIYLPGLNRELTAGQIGQGVVVARIERARDQLLDARIVAQAGGEGYWDTRDKYVRQMEQLHMEVSENGMRPKMDAFWDAWQELANKPAEMASRSALLRRGENLVDSIHDHYKGLKTLQNMANEDIILTVDRVNELSRQIAALNNDISRIEAQGDRPNDLYDRRDLLVDKLSSIVDIRVNRRDPDEFMIHTNGVILVQGKVGRQFEINSGVDTQGYGRIRWTDTLEDFSPAPGSGSLAALLELRDNTIRGEIQSLDNMTMNFIDLVNENHRPGYGLNGRTGLDFFREAHFATNVAGNYDRNGDGEFDSSYIFRINGTNELEERAQIGIAGVITLSAATATDPNGVVQVPYYAEDTVAELIQRINNAGADVAARLNREGRLSLKGTTTRNSSTVDGEPAAPDFVIRHIEDSGMFLSDYAGLLGRGQVYDWAQADAINVLAGDADQFSTAPVANPSAWVDINGVLKTELASIASGYGENGRPANPGNGEAAQAIASIRNNIVMVGRLGTFDDYFADATGRIGMMGEQSERALETQNQIMKRLQELRQSTSGVNMDEELSNMIKFQHGYQAAARFVTTVNSMLEVLMRMGI